MWTEPFKDKLCLRFTLLTKIAIRFCDSSTFWRLTASILPDQVEMMQVAALDLDAVLVIRAQLPQMSKRTPDAPDLPAAKQMKLDGSEEVRRL